MRSIQSVLSFFSVLFFVVGCNTPVATPDAAASDAATSDAATSDAATSDAATSDAATPDAAMADADTDDAGDPCDTCTGTSACLRGVCIATCDVDVATFDAALAADLFPVASYCRSPSAFGFAGGRVYDLTTTTAGMVTTFTLSRWTPGASASPTVEVLGSTTYTALMPGELVFTGGFVTVSPDETQVLFGYTTTRTGSVGGVFDLTTSTMLAIETDSPGNFDATFVDATHYLVDGLGLGMSGGQGLYRGVGGTMGGVQVVDHLGQYSGSIALWEAEGLVLAGGGTFSDNWPDGATGDRMLVFPVADLIAATTVIDATSVQHVEMPSAFELIAGPRLASRHYDGTTFAQDAIEIRDLSRTGTGPVVVGAPENLTTGGTFTAVGAAGEDIILAHGTGLLFVH